MKLSLAALALAHLTKVFPATAQLKTNFTLQQIYYTNNETGPISAIFNSDQLGGGFIVGDFLYLVAGSEETSGALFEVPLVRNGKCSLLASMFLFVIVFSGPIKDM